MAATDRQIELIGGHGERVTVWCETDPAANTMDLRPDNGIWGTTTYAFDTRRLVGVPGEVIDQVTPRPRTFRFPVLVNGATENELDTRLAALGKILDPQRDLRVVFTRPDGTKREIVCRYLAGGDNIAVRRPGQRHVIVPLVLRAFHPFWREVTDEGELAAETFVDAGSAGINSLLLFNRGDVPVWPTIWVHGHVENVEGFNLTTGQGWRIQRVVESGFTVRIETNPLHADVFLNDFPDYAGVMAPGAQFWPLLPGWNWVYMRGITSTGAPAGRFEINFTAEFDTP